MSRLVDGRSAPGMRCLRLRSPINSAIVVGLVIAACSSTASPTPITTQPPSTPPTSSAAQSSPPPPTSTPSATRARIAPGTWTATAAMMEVRKYHTATLLPDGRVLVAGGVIIGSDGSAEPAASAELYDPTTGTWTATGKMTQVRYNHTATLLRDGRVLVTGGWSGLIDPPPTATAELYDPVKGSWSTTGKMVTPRLSHTATLLSDGRVLVTGGWRDGAQRGPAELYDPGTGTWSATAGMLEIRDGHTATLLPDGRVLVAGGRGDSAPDGLAATELYDPGSGTWTATGEMIEARSEHTATLLPDGRVLVAGGGESGTAPAGLAAAEVYDPSRGTWSAAGPMIVARRGNTATVLADGTVLVTGNNWEDPSPAAERYDPGSGTWTAIAGMIETHYGHTATRLLDGRVLVAGGGQTTTAELYDPGGGS